MFGRKWLLLLIPILLCMRGVSAQEAAWKLASAKPLQAVVGQEYHPRYATLAPDGSAVAFWDTDKKQVCLYNFQAAGTQCQTIENFPSFGNYSFPTWSPDGKYLAFTESFFDRLQDSDIWLLDSTTGQIVDKTDDNYRGGLLRSDGSDKNALVDYLPTWNPANGDLYFFRSRKTADRWTTELYLLPVQRKEPKPVRDLTADFPVLSVFRRAAISPDGKQMAIVSVGQQLDDSSNGIYLLRLKDASLKKVADLADLKAGFPEWAKTNTRIVAPDMVTWAGNSGLVVAGSNPEMAVSLSENTVYIDLSSGNVTSLVDFSAVAGQADFLKQPNAPIREMARVGVVSPDGKAFLYLRSDLNQRDAYIAALALPPASEEAVRLADVPDFKILPGANFETFASSDGKALLFNWLFTFEKV